MLIVTPMLSGEPLMPDVVRGVSRLGIDWLVVTSDAPYPSGVREYNINHTRNLAQERARAYVHDYVLLLDSDVVLPAVDFLDEMKSMLATHHVGACMCTKPSDHILAACCLMRTDDYYKLRYMDNPFCCQCRQIAALGGVGYISVMAHEVARSTRQFKGT